MDSTARINVRRQAKTFEEMLLPIVITRFEPISVPKIIGNVIAATIALRNAASGIFAAWLTLFAVIQVVDFFVIRWLRTHGHTSPARALRIPVIVTLVDGVCLALCLIQFGALSQFERAAVTIIFAGLCSSSVTTTAVYRPIFFAYTVPTLLPVALLWIVFPGDHQAWIGWSLSILAMAYAHYLYERAKDIGRLARESFDIQQERVQLNSELQAALESVTSAREDAQVASNAKTRFLASASHDLRQPIQTLSLFGAALAMRPLDERSRQIASNMNIAIQDLSCELDALLDVSKLDAGVVQLQSAPFRLAPLLEHIYTLFAPAALEKRLTLEVSCPQEAWTRTDCSHLDRVIRNLVENAIKYTDAGSIRVIVQREGNSYQLAVIDTGIGISEDNQTRVFEEFYQINNPERDRKRGLGLGLSIVKRLVAMLEIPLQLTSSPLGTRIVLMIPVAEPVTSAATALATPEHSISPLHVLAIDDEERVRVSMKTLLEELGCTVSIGAGTEDAVKEVQQRVPDLLLTDLRLRGADNGVETIRAVRAILPNLPALIISGDSAPERLLEAQAAGITMIHKPISSKTLLDEIAKLVAPPD